MNLNRIENAISREERNKLNENWDKITQGVAQVETKANEALSITDALIQGKIDDAALKTNIEQKLNDLETEYAPELTSVSLKLSTVTPEDFGAVGDGVTDDYDAIMACFNSYAHKISFGEGKTYVVRTFGFSTSRSNLLIEMNGSRIKLKDSSGLLTRIYNSTELANENCCFFFTGNNIKVKDGYFDANADNNFFIHNGGTYYGYQQDIGISGIPNKYITTYGVKFHGSNAEISNCHFNDFGSSIRFSGETFLSDDFVRFGKIYDCSFSDGFRDQITIAQASDVEIYNCKFKNNQRKAIQLYLKINNATISGCTVDIIENEIRQWYPTWSTSQPDAEMSGFAVKNPGYPDFEYLVQDVTIANNKVYNAKNGIFIRDYSKNIKIESNYFESCQTVVQSTTGINGNVTFNKNELVSCTNGLLLTLQKNSAIVDSLTSEIVSSLSIKDNIMSVKGSLLNLDPKGLLNLYKRLTIQVLDNTCVDNASPLRFSDSINNIPFLVLVQHNNKVNGKIRDINRYGNRDVSDKFNNRYVIKTNATSAKPSSGYDFVKLFTLKCSVASSSAFLRGCAYNTSGSNIRYCDFYVSIRTHFENIATDSIIEAKVSNVIGNRAANTIQIVDRLEDSVRVIDVYGYVNNDGGQTVFEFLSPEGITDNYTFVESDSNVWVNTLPSGIVTVSTIIS